MTELAPSHDFNTSGPKIFCIVCDHPRAIHIFRNNRYLCLKLVSHPTLGYISCNCTQFVSGEVNAHLPNKVA